MKRTNRSPFVVLSLIIGCVSPLALSGTEWEPLLDADLSKWEKWIGVPHTSVEGLGDHPRSENVHKGTPLGNSDPLNVFSVTEEEGAAVLKVSGQIYGGLTTLEEYEDYRIRFKFKWGELKYEPRVKKLRDSGILYHCTGDHGAFWNVWMRSLECQIQERDFGDLFLLAGTGAEAPSKQVGEKNFRCDFYQRLRSYGKVGDTNGGRVRRLKDHEKKHGEWNEIEVVTMGQTSMHVINGKVVMLAKNARYKDGDSEVPLTKGKIQLQSEGAEAYFKEIEIMQIDSFPAEYVKQVGEAWDKE